MSTPNTTQMTCPKCSTTFDIEQYNVINAQTQPELREKLRDGSMFLQTCPRCGTHMHAAYTCVYSNDEKKFLVSFQPSTEKPAVTPLMPQYKLRLERTLAGFLERIRILEAELDDELGYGRYDYRNKDTDNSRNGHSSKTLRTSYGDVEVAVPRDRKGEFEPQLLKKNQTSVSQDIEEKILSMYAKGMTTGDIETHIQDIYGIEVSDTTISRITDKILPIAKEWQQRPLEAVYAVVFLDAIHYHVRSEGQIVKKAVYIALGINLDGKKMCWGCG